MIQLGQAFSGEGIIFLISPNDIPEKMDLYNVAVLRFAYLRFEVGLISLQPTFLIVKVFDLDIGPLLRDRRT
jgi:hypothetical protein